MPKKEEFKAGFVTLTGKPNVGKSTLLNKLVGEKIAIISPRPQTTRNIIKGVVTFEEAQIVFIDTPGLTQIEKAPSRLDRRIIEETLLGLEGVDVVVFMADNRRPSSEDYFIMDHLEKIKKPVILAISKVDKAEKSEVESLLETYKKYFPFSKSIPISAKKGTNLSILVGEIIHFLPSHPPYYSSDLVTDQAERILAGELIREKIFELTRQEVPYSAMVNVEEFKERSENLTYISATIYVEHSSQRGILVGKKGSMIKKIGLLARKEIENRFNCRVYLDLRVGVKKNWRKI
ncbi:GTPase Era [Candidatus Aerophobetes bacterium]|nr:GTPase Era [Candidatus Aerophobetes bacterium]